MVSFGYCILLPLVTLLCCFCIPLAESFLPAANDASHHFNVTTTTTPVRTTSRSDSKFFVKEIFDKYGENGVMTLRGFEELLESIGLGQLVLHHNASVDHSGETGVAQLTHSHSHHQHHHASTSKAANLVKRSNVTSNHGGEDVGPSTLPRNSSQVVESATNNNTSISEPKTNVPLEEGAVETRELDITRDLHRNETHTQHHRHSAHQLNYLPSNQCLTVTEIYQTFDIKEKISVQQFAELCPAIIYELDQKNCNGFHEELTPPTNSGENKALVWVYASAAVIVISLSGLLVVAVIPIIHGSFYQMLLQFLVALAVGSLTGDALLHLMPHALASDDSHHHHHHHESFPSSSSSSSSSDSHSDVMVWKGLVAVIGILLFFMAERLLTVISTRRKRNSEAQAPAQVKILKEDLEMSRTVGEKLCKHKYNSYGYCYGDVTLDMLEGLNDCEDKDHHNCLEKQAQMESDLKRTTLPCSDDVQIITRGTLGEGDNSVAAPHHHDMHHHDLHHHDMDPTQNNGVIVSEHEHRHHGHSHTHTHTVPASVSAVAWMVIMGDGLHNFSDGLAIGAAFANSVTGGLSTSIAVFCHELPHELGDFAILLKSGMTAKQAIMYNGLSSVLCFMGMLLGVALGNVVNVSPWIFAGAAGMFVYIALVDMIPELNSTPTISTAKESDKTRLGIQFLGMVIGVTIMLLIALYEHDLKSIISE